MRRTNQEVYEDRMKAVTALCNALAISFGIVAVMLLVGSELKAFQAKRAYESGRAEHEAYRRTVGRSVDSAFICKEKPNANHNLSNANHDVDSNF
jgi:hypothetical protein